MYNTIIEVEAFGDFDVVYTKCIMVSEEKLDTNIIIKEFCEFANIPSIKGLPYNKLNHYTDEFIVYLEMIGFTVLKTTQIYMSE